MNSSEHLATGFLFSSLSIACPLFTQYTYTISNRVRGINVAHLLVVGKVMSSMLGPNRDIAKDVKSCYLLLLYLMRDIKSMRRGNALSLNRRTSLPCTVRTSRQRSCNQRVGCLKLLGSRALGPAKRSGPWLL